MAPPRILVVDDDVPSLEGLARLLALDGFDVVALSAPAEAIGRVAREHFDAVLTDLEMPGASGVEVVRAAQAREPAPVVLVMTGYAGSSPARAALTAGARRVLDKPLEYDALIAALRELLGIAC